MILNVHEAQQQGRHVPAGVLQAQIGKTLLHAMRQGLVCFVLGPQALLNEPH